MSDDDRWLLLGFGGQTLFMGRFVIQWLASERDRRSVIPVSFWYLSIAGALVLLAYALHRHDPVFVAGQGLGVAIYLRNLQLIRRSAHGRQRDLRGQHERHAGGGDEQVRADRRRDADRGRPAGAAAGHDGGARHGGAVGPRRDPGQRVDAEDENEGR